MDDILKRMLAVEQEADSIIKAARTEADAIMEQGLQKANEIAANAQKALAEEAEALMTSRVAAALEDKKARLENADREMTAQLEEFAKKLEGHLDAAVDALLYPSL